MKSNIALIGMMGSGKTTVGKVLSKLLPDFKYIDVDEEIEKSSGKKISEIFLKFGEAHFRILESEKIEKILKNKKQIISAGGGLFEKEENRKLLLENATVIYLETSSQEIFSRIKNEFHRPLLKKNFSVERINEILSKRDVNYRKADIIIKTDNKNPERIAKEIFEAINA